MKHKAAFLALGLATQMAWAGWDEGVAAYKVGNFKVALTEFEALANKGDAAAQANLGMMYENGLGVIQDYKEAVNWYGRSADQRHIAALNRFGTMYELGRGGLTADPVVAYALYNLAAASQNTGAITNRDRLQSKMSPQQIELAQSLTRAMTGYAPSYAITTYQYEQSPAGKIEHSRKRAVENFGKTLPKKIGGFDRSESIGSGPGFISVTYYSQRTVSRLNLAADQAKLAKTVKQEVCRIEPARKILQAGTKINFSFKSNYSQISKFFFDASDCDSANASQPARSEFNAYSATLYHGPTHPLVFSGPNKSFAMYRTRLREGMATGVNFAGNLTLIEIGCGTSCRFVRVGNAETGMLYGFPLGGEDNMELDLEFQSNSRLVIASWKSYEDEKCYQDRFVWNGKKFDHMSREETAAYKHGTCQ